MLAHFEWLRDRYNPILPPVPNSKTESTRCMNPFVLRVSDQYRLYYSGGDDDGCQRICLATSPAKAPLDFTRHGPILDLGEKGHFDAHWCVLPYVHRFGEKWHLYYTGNDGGKLGLQSFPGVGLAISKDGLQFQRFCADPIITGDQTSEFPQNRGIAGGGTIVEDRLPNGSVQYRLYYTLAVGIKSADVRIDQEKHCAVCHSHDGVHWFDHRLIMSPRPDVKNEDIAVAAPFVWRDGELYRMLYCGIGTRWGYYSISEAVSEDGYGWYRREGDENLSLEPGASGSWESKMVEYPSVIAENGRLRLFYCGNNYGSTGIGTAVARYLAIEAHKAG